MNKVLKLSKSYRQLSSYKRKRNRRANKSCIQVIVASFGYINVLYKNKKFRVPTKEYNEIVDKLSRIYLGRGYGKTRIINEVCKHLYNRFGKNKKLEGYQCKCGRRFSSERGLNIHRGLLKH